MAQITKQDGTVVTLKPWSRIEPTLIGSDFNRYEVIEWQDSNHTLLAYLKMPCKGMDGCDHCPGPHRPTNTQCSQTRLETPRLPTPPPNAGGLYLCELFTGRQLPGLWILDQTIMPGRRKSALAILRR